MRFRFAFSVLFRRGGNFATLTDFTMLCCDLVADICVFYFDFSVLFGSGGNFATSTDDGKRWTRWTLCSDVFTYQGGEFEETTLK